ncbi:hypothetical protein CKA27_21260 [Vibrio coralliilyticus]|nr:hypothetical protein CKA27_21260 [Vibrio coralliilyticus]
MRQHSQECSTKRSDSEMKLTFEIRSIDSLFLMNKAYCLDELLILLRIKPWQAQHARTVATHAQ